MNTRQVATFGAIVLANQLVFADASYQVTTQMTSGTLQGQLQSNPFTAGLMKDRFAPINTITMVHGNQKAVVNKDSREIFDLDKETVTRLDTVKKTYTVVTFAQMRQAMANMPQQMAQAQAQMKLAQKPGTDPKMSFDVAVKNVGVPKVVNGLSAQEQVVTLQMHATDPNAPAAGAGSTVTYVVTADVWVAPDPPEMKEIQDFDRRMGQKMMAGIDTTAFAASASASGNAGLAAVFGGHPGSAEAMAQMGKEMAKLKGTRVLEVTSIGGDGPAAAPSNPATSPAAAGTQTTVSAPLMQMTVQMTNFSHETIPSAIFEVPSGYMKIDSPYGRMSK